MTQIDTALAQLSADDITFKLVNGLFKVLPGAPELEHYDRLEDAGFAGEGARAFAESEAAGRALKVANAIDLGDAGISVYTGVSSALSFFFGAPEKKAKAFETDPQQAADAALKALAIGYLGYELFEGTIPERVKAMVATPAGQALLYYYAAVEVALPFTDDALKGGGSVIKRLMDKFGEGNAAKLDAAAGSGAAAKAKEMLAGLTSALDGVIAKAAQHTGPMLATAKQHLPTAMATADTVAGVVATAADALPVYRMLGARLVAEAALRRG